MFIINGITWCLVFVEADSDDLRRSDGSLTVGVTDNNTKCVYLSNLLHGKFLKHVICHELTHCFCFAHDISMPIEQEEFMANFIADYGEELIYLLDDLMKSIRKIA